MAGRIRPIPSHLALSWPDYDGYLVSVSVDDGSADVAISPYASLSLRCVYPTVDVRLRDLFLNNDRQGQYLPMSGSGSPPRYRSQAEDCGISA
jgi:hypothetical protein